MKNPTPNVAIAITAAALLFSFHSVQAQTCQEKRDACVAECKQKDPAKKEACIKQCDDAAKECANRTTLQPQLPSKRLDLKACLEGGAPCRQPVAKICKLIAGPCEDCWKTLCGGNWSFEAGLPLQVKLVAATSGKNGRVLATSSMKGKQAVLKVPQIKLNKQEQLYFEFSSKQKPTGPVKLQVQKS